MTVTAGSLGVGMIVAAIMALTGMRRERAAAYDHIRHRIGIA